MAQKRRRGVSIGTILAFLISAAVAFGFAMVLPRLNGNTDIRVGTREVLQAMNLRELMPSLTMSDIPMGDTPASQATNVPDIPIATIPPAATQKPVETTAPTASPVPQGGSFRITIGGSVHVEDAVRKSGYYSESKKYDFDEIMSLLTPYVTGDVSIVTLENLIMPDKNVSDLIAPEDVASMLGVAGFNTVALGFRKVYDQGMAGLTSTVQAVQNHGLRAVGVFPEKNPNAATIMTADNVKIAVLHYTDGLSSKGTKAVKKDGTAYAVPQADIAAITADIRNAREQGAAVVIVMMNWGTNGKAAVTKQQKELAQMIANAGADVIVGAGSRVIQEIDWLEATRTDGTKTNVLCAYSLGCLISDSRKNGNVAGMLLYVDITCDANGTVTIDNASYTPTYVWRYKVDSKYSYRVVAANKAPPDGMSDDQIESMQRAAANVLKSINNNELTEE